MRNHITLERSKTILSISSYWTTQQEHQHDFFVSKIQRGYVARHSKRGTQSYCIHEIFKKTKDRISIALCVIFIYVNTETWLVPGSELGLFWRLVMKEGYTLQEMQELKAFT